MLEAPCGVFNLSPHGVDVHLLLLALRCDDGTFVLLHEAFLGVEAAALPAVAVVAQRAPEERLVLEDLHAAALEQDVVKVHARICVALHLLKLRLLRGAYVASQAVVASVRFGIIWQL